jgi:hypothetical protein
MPRYYSQKFGGIVADHEAPPGFLALEVRNKINLGDQGELITPDHKTIEFKVEKILNLKGDAVTAAHGGCGVYFIESPVKVPAMSLLSLSLQ